jgi:hypothetical protein
MISFFANSLGADKWIDALTTYLKNDVLMNAKL